MTGRLHDRRHGRAFYTIPPEAGEIVGMMPAEPPNAHLVLVDCTRAVLVVDTRLEPPTVDLKMLGQPEPNGPPVIGGS